MTRLDVCLECFFTAMVGLLAFYLLRPVAQNQIPAVMASRSLTEFV
jgi:hypothetical protein